MFSKDDVLDLKVIQGMIEFVNMELGISRKLVLDPIARIEEGFLL